MWAASTLLLLTTSGLWPAYSTREGVVMDTRPPDLVLALTGDDEDNLVISQLSRERYGVTKIIARVNDPRNQAHFDLLGVSPTICPTQRIMALIEHEVPQHDVVHLLDLGPAGRLAPDLGGPRRQGRDRRGRHGAGRGRPGARHPRARRRGRGARAPDGPVT